MPRLKQVDLREGEVHDENDKCEEVCLCYIARFFLEDVKDSLKRVSADKA